MLADFFNASNISSSLCNLCHFPEANCKYYMSGISGTIDYPLNKVNYDSTKNCMWVIEGPIGSKVQVTVSG